MKKRIVSQGLAGVFAAAMVFGSVVMPLNVQAEESAEDAVIDVVVVGEKEAEVTVAEEGIGENAIVEGESLAEESAKVEAQKWALESAEPVIEGFMHFEYSHLQDRAFQARPAMNLIHHIFGINDGNSLRTITIDGRTFDYLKHEWNLSYIQQIPMAPVSDDPLGLLEELEAWIELLMPLLNVYTEVTEQLATEGSQLNNNLSNTETRAVQSFMDKEVTTFLGQTKFTAEELKEMSNRLQNILALDYVPGVGETVNEENGTDKAENTDNGTTNSATDNTINSTTNTADTQANSSKQNDITGKAAKVTAPNTGDVATTMMYGSLVFLASGVIATLVIRKKKVA